MERVLDEVDENLLNQQLVPLDFRKRGIDFGDELCGGLEEKGLTKMFHVRQESWKVERTECLRCHAAVVSEAGEDLGRTGRREVDPPELFIDLMGIGFGGLDLIAATADEGGDGRKCGLGDRRKHLEHRGEQRG